MFRHGFVLAERRFTPVAQGFTFVGESLMSPSWDEWLAENLARDCDREELFGIMVAKGFDSGEARALVDQAIAVRGETMRTGSPGGLFLPTAITLHDASAELYGVDGFLNDGECAYLVELIRQHLRESTTTEEGLSTFRTSRTCDLNELDDALVTEVDRRLCAFIAPPYTQLAEPI